MTTSLSRWTRSSHYLCSRRTSPAGSCDCSMASRRLRLPAANPASTLAAANSPSKMTGPQPTAAPERSERPDTGEDRYHTRGGLPAGVLGRLKADPDHAAERFVLFAVDKLAEKSRAYVATLDPDPPTARQRAAPGAGCAPLPGPRRDLGHPCF